MEGVAQSELCTALNVAHAQLTDINAQFKSISELLSKAGAVKVANSIWMNEKTQLHFRDSYTFNVQAYYAAKAASFNNAHPINNWCSGKTNGKINEILNPSMALPTLVLVNAVYFKANWRRRFDSNLTQDSFFHPAQGASTRCRMMRMSHSFKYIETDSYQAVCLPYEAMGSVHLDAVVVLRKGDQYAYPEWLQLCTALSLAAPREGQLQLPRFRCEAEFSNIADDLHTLGVTEVFKEFPPNLCMRPMIKDPFPAAGLKVDTVIHKVYVEVDEAGTEAAAITAVTASFGCAAVVREQPFHMNCDSPFSFTICERSSGLRLFVGEVRKIE